MSSSERMGCTPGPWIAREQFSKDGTSLGWIIDHANGRIGWSSYATAKPNQGEGPPYPISAANAKLIAAAPDLVKALEDALKELEYVFAKHGYVTTEIAANSARTALSNATPSPCTAKD